MVECTPLSGLQLLHSVEDSAPNWLRELQQL